MITNEERREVAARLRRFESDEVSSCSEYLEKLDEIIGINGCEETGSRLADLIEPEHYYNGHVVEVDGQRYVPERFCKIIFKEERFGLCSCGQGIFSDMIYCCRCGAKVPENLWE